MSLLAQAQLVVMLECHLWWQAQHLVMSERYFSWQAHHVVMSFETSAPGLPGSAWL